LFLVCLFLFLEPMMGFEPMTSSLPRKCSTPELHRLLVPFGTRASFDDRFEANQCPGLLQPERETRLEPATYSLEGCRSTN